MAFGDRLPPAPLPAGLSPLPAPVAERVGRDRVLPGRPWAAEQAAGWDVFALERPGFAGGVAAAWGRVLGAPELRSCCSQPPCSGGGDCGVAGPPPPPPGEEGVIVGAAGSTRRWARRGFGALWFLPAPARGQAGRRGRCESDGAARPPRAPADVRGPPGGARGSPRAERALAVLGEVGGGGRDRMRAVVMLGIRTGGALRAPCSQEGCEQTLLPGGHHGAGEASVAEQRQRWPMDGGSTPHSGGRSRRSCVLHPEPPVGGDRRGGVCMGPLSQGQAPCTHTCARACPRARAPSSPAPSPRNLRVQSCSVSFTPTSSSAASA